jgi:hypothetical protein
MSGYDQSISPNISPAKPFPGLSAVFEKVRTSRGAASVVALLAAGALAGYNWSLQTGAERAIRDGLKEHQVDKKTPSQLVQMPSFRFVNPLDSSPGMAQVMSREGDGCYMVEAIGGNTQGLTGRDTVKVHASGKVLPAKPLSHMVKICP